MGEEREIVYGVHAVEELAMSQPERVVKVLLSSGRGKLEKWLKEKGIPVQKVPPSKINVLCGNAKHQGVLAIVSPVRYASLDEISPSESIVVALDGVEDPRNLGAILRTAEAVGVKSVILPSRRSAGITPAVVKTSSGAVARLRVVRVNSMVSSLLRLKDIGFWIIGADLEGGQRYDETDYPSPSVLVLGREGKGLHRSTRKLCDMRVYIPMYGKVQSLNVSVAAGIILYEMVKRLRAKPA
ncbi:MAG: 23S rRNA (guanosine(2251)-2'-O)-methyltransferase RlmB [Synergistetes bacterium]|nr:23S rRNA (guanosine(2251)-2'-O)-methyltransferase RlmB [Synergistota bacterium]